MPTQDSVVSIPFVGGLNQQLDPDQLQPPELTVAENVVVRRGGRLEKRAGLQMVTPSAVFDGASTQLPINVEALGEYVGDTGSRAVLAGDNNLYEYVGSDSTHGWRQVNEIPRYLGSLDPVTASGGVILEVEALEDATGTYRTIVWITGQRDGQELSSDRVYREQTAGPGNEVYYAVQYVATGAFVKPPTVLDSGDPNVMMNLRLVKVQKDQGSSANGYYIGVAYQIGTPVSPVAASSFSGDIKFKVINPSDGAILVTVSSLNLVSHACHRAFDVVGLTGALGPSLIVVSCRNPDSNSSVAGAWAELPAVKWDINTTTWNFSSAATTSDVILHGVAVPGTTKKWEPWAYRGVVLDQDATNTVAFAARAVTRYYDGAAFTNQLDGQLIVGKLAITANSIAATNQAFVPQIGFQTADTLSYVLAPNTSGTTGNHSLSATLQSRIPLGTGNISTSATLPHTASATWSQTVVTATLADGTTQSYVPGFGSIGMSLLYARTVDTLEPYHAVETTQIVASGLFPEPLHQYPAGAPLTGTIALNQVTQVELRSGGGATNAGFVPGVHTGCNLQIGGVTAANVTVYVDAGGAVTEIAIENGLPGAAGFVNSITPLNTSGLTGGTPAVGAGTFTGHHCYAYLIDASAIPGPMFDYPNTTEQASGLTYTNFYGDRGFEECVHRWDVKLGSSNRVLVALSSTSANRFTTPNGAVAYGAADPHRQNNFFEVYKWPSTQNGPLVNPLGGSTNTIVAALGGPWRLVAGLQKIGSTYYCGISPSGDAFQRNTFLVRIGEETQTATIYAPVPVADPESPVGVTDFTYTSNKGMFVESCNMMRVTTPPLNVPALRLSSTGLLCGALRDGSSKGTQEVFSIAYDNRSTTWRRLLKMNDYTFINGGVLSVFDSVGANECTSLIWPQYDFTSVAWDTSPDFYYTLVQGSQLSTPLAQTGPQQYQASAFWNRRDNDAWSGYFLNNISRPYFKYEAGFQDKNGYNNTFGNGWSIVETRWGGDPSKDYQTAYADPRAQQLNAAARTPYGAGMASFGLKHYYGRYQEFSSGLSANSDPFQLADDLSAGGKLTLWVWAPRTANKWEPVASSMYNEATAGGDFLMRWVYEYADGTGRMVRSAPSNATKYTICAEIIGAPQDPKNGTPPRYNGGQVTEFRWGFFAPSLELTNRLKTANLDSRRVVIQPYSTAEPYSTICYRVPFSNFKNSQNDFVLPRNSTRGVVPYSVLPYSGFSAANPLGYVFNNFTCFDGPTGDYNGILSEPYLYTTGGVLDNVPPPAIKVMCVHQNRLIAGGADDTTVVWISKELTPTDAPGFNDALTLTIADGGAVTGLASLNGNLIVFKKATIFVVPGVLPDATGNAQSMGEPIKLPAGVGCIDHRSLVETPVGVFFLSERGLEILYPTLQVEQIGQKVKETLAAYPTIVSAVHNPDDQEVRFLAKGSAGGIVVCYSYQFNVWSTHKSYAFGAYSTSIAQMALVDGRPWVVSNQQDGTSTAVYKQSDDSGLDVIPDFFGAPAPAYVKMKVYTAPIDMNQVQGYQRVKRARLLCTQNVIPGQAPDNLPAVSMKAQTDYNAAYYQTSSWTSTQLASVLSTQGRAQIEVHLAEQKGQKVTVGFEEGDPASTPDVADKCWGLALSNVSLVVGLKRGLDKRILPEAKH